MSMRPAEAQADTADGEDRLLSFSDANPMNLKELVDSMSQDINIPAGQVRLISLAVMAEMANLIEAQENFFSPVVTFQSLTSKPTAASEGKPAVPARKFARMAINPKLGKPALASPKG